MKILLLTALVATVVLARRSETNVGNQAQWPWQVGKLYRYDVESKTLARLPEGASTGNAFRARFIVRVPAPGRLQAKLLNPEQASVHQELPQDNSLPDNLKYEYVQSLEHHFDISVNGGRVEYLSLPSSLHLTDENFLKGLIGALQVDLSAHRTVRKSDNNFDWESQQGQFKKMETDVTGDCETLYTVSPAAPEWRRELSYLVPNEEPIEITKSKSYGHCHHRVAYHFGVPEGAEWTGTAHDTKEEQFMKRATTSRILAGKQGTIYKAETTSTVYVHPHLSGKQKAEVYSHVQLQLTSYEEDNEEQWQTPQDNRMKNLLFSFSDKQVMINDKSSSSESQEHHKSSSTESKEHHKSSSTESREQNSEEQSQTRQRRSTRSHPKIVSINKVIIKKRSDEDSDSSSDSTSAYVNDDIPNEKEPPYASLYKKDSPAHAQKLVQEMAQQLQNPNNMPKGDFLSKFHILVRVLSSMSYEQLSRVSHNMEAARSSDNILKVDMWMIYRDAVAQAGTLPAFHQIKSWIQKKHIQGEEAAEVVASMVNNLNFPTKQTMIQFFELAMSPEVSEQKYLNSTALIAATRFINMGQVNNETAHSYYPTHYYGRLAQKHDTFVYDQILPRLRHVLHKAIQEQDSQKAQVYIKAIGNLGHRSILEVFSPYLEGKLQVSVYLRALMIDNLQILAQQQDRYARAVLYSILRNTAESYEVRVAAIQNIFLSQPTSAMMQAMAQMTHDDPSIQVRAALKSAIKSAANLKHPRYHSLARTAQAASSLLTKEKFGKQYSSKDHVEYFDSEYDLGIMRELSYTGSEDSLLPKFLKYAVKSKTSGWNSISASASSVQQLIDLFRQQDQHNSDNKANHKYSAQKIADLLNIKRDSQNPLEAAIYINLMNQQRYYTFSEDDLRQLRNTMRQYLSQLSQGVETHYTKVLNQAQISVVFPVAAGMPFVYKYREPTVVHIHAKAKGQLPSEGQTGSLETEIHFTFARNIDGSVGFVNPFSKRISSVGVVNKAQLSIPLKIHVQMQEGELKIRVEPQRPDQDTTIAHFSVWPYSTKQDKDSIVPVSQDPNTKGIERKNKRSAIDFKFGQSIGSQFQVQGFSYSHDYNNMGNMFQSTDLLTNIALALRQNDIAMTQYNFRYLAKQSVNKAVTFTAVYDKYYNLKHGSQEPLAPSNMEDLSPNSDNRRQQMVKRVAADIQNAYAQVVDLSATFEGPQKTEFVLTGAMANSPVDSKIQYVFVAGKNTPQESSQINGIGMVNKPDTSAMNFLDALQKDLKMTYDFNIKFGKSNGNIHITGHTDRTKNYIEALKKHAKSKQCTEDMAKNNFYQKSCHKVMVMAHAADYLKASVQFKDVTPAFRDLFYRAYRFAEHFGYWYTDVYPNKASPDGKLDIEVEMNYLEQYMNLALNTRYGEVRMRNVPIPKVSAGALSYYPLFKTSERVANYYTHHQYLPYCSVDGNKIRTFSDRDYMYTLTPSWHVVMQDKAPEGEDSDDQLVVLARKSNQKQQEIYISFAHQNGQNLEIQIQPAQEDTNKPKVNVNTNSKKISEGDLTMYWDDKEDTPLLEYYTRRDGVLILHIRENRLRAMYDGERLVVLAHENRDNTRGICGYMSGEPRDDYKTPRGLVDEPSEYAASYALSNEHSDSRTQQMQEQAKKSAYQPYYQYATILRSDKEWQKAMKDSSEEKEDSWNSHNVYRVRHYSKQQGRCTLKKQVQYYENHGEICITTAPLDSCQSHCNGGEYQLQAAQVVCRPKLDQQFQQYKNEIREGQSPKVTGVPHIKQYSVPTSCKA